MDKIKELEEHIKKDNKKHLGTEITGIFMPREMFMDIGLEKFKGVYLYEADYLFNNEIKIMRRPSDG